jgi:hypothetical protein
MRILPSLLRMLALAMTLAFAPAVALAQSADDAFARLNADSFSDTARAIDILVQSAHPNAAVIIEALADGRLLAGGGAVAVKTKDGGFLDAKTGQVLAAAPIGLSPVRLNNNVRRVIQGALGGLGLINPDPAKRVAAAEAVFRARDVSVLPVLEAAIAKESNDRARRALREWRAGQNVWYGLSLGSVLLLAAIGLAITFGVMGVINMAHGEMVMLGAYTTFVVQEFIRASARGCSTGRWRSRCRPPSSSPARSASRSSAASSASSMAARWRRCSPPGASA